MNVLKKLPTSLDSRLAVRARVKDAHLYTGGGVFYFSRQTVKESTSCMRG